ncbi:iron complex transport system permease protein [Nocardioides albertanoniae]|uniref:Iron complex transport system permease protein n=1 Tax=Nocardioides albertanoniae TaxID=1175486 RepID=A0A543A2H1_9ACTN|nr:iron ABC transporter permease [Nocardioides albertanoniae]TQL66771.1 iron complex transport system permease protein [Nocardioides albertanoniae]
MTLTVAPHRAPAAPQRGRGWSGLPTAGLLVGVVLLAVVASLLIGAKLVSPLDLWRDGSVGQGIIQARMPRTVLGVVVGAALAVAGGCLQGLTRNPLADPGLLGINAGATFAMVIAVSVFGIGSLSGYVWFAFVGAALAMVLVHTVAAFGAGGATPAKLVLAGAALSAGVASWTAAVLLRDKATFDVLRQWQVGTVGGRGWDVILTALPFLVVGAVLALTGARTLDTLALGDDLAKGLGRRTAVDRVVVGLGIVLLTGTATALCGPIGFVGLVVPHMVRTLVGSAYTRVLPLSAGFGAALTLLADVVGRVVWAPSEIQVGVMTAIVGVPVFVYFLRRGRMAGL